MIKQRNVALCIILSLLTCGIYSIYWFVCQTEDTKTAANVEGTSGIVSYLLCVITCNIYGLYWAYKQGEKLDIAKQNRNQPASNSSVLYLILCLLFPIAAWALMQNELNKLAEA